MGRDGKIKLYETWQWLNDDKSKGNPLFVKSKKGFEEIGFAKVKTYSLLRAACCAYKKDNLFHKLFFDIDKKVENLLFILYLSDEKPSEERSFSNEQFH